MNTKKLTNLLKSMQGAKSQAKFAEEMGVSSSRLGTYLRGEVKEPTVDFLEKVAAYNDTNVNSLLSLIADSPGPLRAKENSAKYSLAVTTFEDLAPELDQLNKGDVVRAIHHLSSRLITA